jgi:hypothetical protein
MVKCPIIGVIDEQGYLCTPNLKLVSATYPLGAPVYRGVELIATDDPDLNPLNPLYNVTYTLKGPDGVRLAYPEP